MVIMAAENEGSRIVRKLIALDVSVWRIAKECGVSYQTGKAWRRGWWNPDMGNTYKLMAFLHKIEHTQKYGF